MVKFRFTLFALLLMFSFFNSKSFAAPQLFLFVTKSENILGRPIHVEIYGVSLKGKITELNLDVLNKQFGVISDYVINDTQDKRWPNMPIQILKLKLYPKVTGEVVIPSLSINHIETKQQRIKILKGNTSVPKIELSTQTPYERQQMIFTVSITSQKPDARLSIKPEQIIESFDNTPLLFKRSKTQNGLYLLKIGWALSAFNSGQTTIKLPPIEYRVSGVLRKKFYLPSTTINVKPLPRYLPPTIPIGKISVQSDEFIEGAIYANSLSYWNITVRGQTNNIYNLPPILRQIKSNDDILFLPENSSYNIIKKERSVNSEKKYSIPIKPLHSGFLTLPQIKLQYFNPENGRIETVIYNAKPILVLSVFWRGVIIIFIVLLLGYLSFNIKKILSKLSFSKLKRTQALHILGKNNTVNDIREALHLISEAEDWNKNITTKQWAIYWKTRYQVDFNFDILISNISLLLYSSKNNPEQTALQLKKLIMNRKKHKFKISTSLKLLLQ